MPGTALSSAVLPCPGRMNCGLAHLADDFIVDPGDDLRPELGLGHVRVDIDQKIVFVTLRLPGGMGEDVAGVGLGRDLVEFTKALGARSSIDGVSRKGAVHLRRRVQAKLHLRVSERQAAGPQTWAYRGRERSLHDAGQRKAPERWLRGFLRPSIHAARARIQ